MLSFIKYFLAIENAMFKYFEVKVPVEFNNESPDAKRGYN